MAAYFTLTLDTTPPVVTVTGPDVSSVSLVPGKDVCAFSFTANEDFTAYEVRVTPSSDSGHSAGTVLGVKNGSVNMSGDGFWSAGESVTCKIHAADLQAASAGDGAKIIKVFAQDALGNWST